MRIWLYIPVDLILLWTITVPYVQNMRATNALNEEKYIGQWETKWPGWKLPYSSKCQPLFSFKSLTVFTYRPSLLSVACVDELMALRESEEFFCASVGPLPLEPPWQHKQRVHTQSHTDTHTQTNMQTCIHRKKVMGSWGKWNITFKTKIKKIKYMMPNEKVWGTKS